MQIKNTMKYHYTHKRMAKNLNAKMFCIDVDQLELSNIAGGM